MPEGDSTTRRRIIEVAGAAGITALLAGCADEDPEEETPEEDEPAADEDEPEAENDDEEDEAAADDDEENDEDEEDEENDDEDEPIDPDQEILLEGTTDGWTGVEPEAIADEENPTLLLLEGESYEITWENGDGEEHNLEIRDDTYGVVDDYETDLMDEEGETETLEIDEVTDEMVQYLCSVHETEMVGEVAVEAQEDDENEDE
ncbi:cupredoxin domain-containing protein [Natronobacterium texcoconense]|uniref:Copper binding protein, plastocyanin/azurin family n=1 Tax=Natronobacterium texcoconense TaxID=1095778 RepID=A0A1H1ANT1_NATTX|nr:plastocyanin/azurin family copper-binding protein [Natronobacterium texcoconense]SDQ41418.1 Copper binding protein, plastocyanin/azurin family [Natronobacterium texcoconense]